MSLKLQGINVLIITSGHNVTDGRVYDKHARSMLVRGAKVTIIGMLGMSERPKDVNLIIISGNQNRLERFFIRPWRCLWAARSQKPDILHVHDAEMLIVLPVARRLWRKAKFVYDVHEDFGNLILIREWLPKRFRWFLKHIIDHVERFLARRADGIVSVTEPLTDKFRDHKHRVAAYNFVSSDFIKKTELLLKEPESRTYDLVHLGALSSDRGRFLEKIIRDLHEQRPDSRSLIIGAPANLMTPLSKLHKNCDVRGKVPYNQIAELLVDCKVGIDVHPDLKPHLVPALPVKIFEYMCCGCSVVTSSMPVLDKLIAQYSPPEESLRIVKSGRYEDYLLNVIAQIDKINSGFDLGAPLRSLIISDLNWEAEADKIAELYSELLAD